MTAAITYSGTGITAAAVTGAAGNSVAITAGAGNGSTNAGGNVNLVAGAAASTGIPGAYQANGDANMFFVSYSSGAPTAVDTTFFVATRACIVKTISEVHSVAAGGTSTMTVMTDTGTTAPGAGTSLHQSGSFNLNATANTVQNATVATTITTVSLAAGDRLSVHWLNAIQSTTVICVTVGLSYL